MEVEQRPRRRAADKGTASTASTASSPAAPTRPGRGGQKPGDRRVRVNRPHEPYFRHVAERTLVAKEAAHRPRTRAGRALARARAILFGRPLSMYEEVRERLGVIPGLSIFASDNISSS